MNLNLFRLPDDVYVLVVSPTLFTKIRSAPNAAECSVTNTACVYYRIRFAFGIFNYLKLITFGVFKFDAPSISPFYAKTCDVLSFHENAL